MTSGMECEILFRKPKRIKDLANLGVKKARLLIIFFFKKQIDQVRIRRIRRDWKRKATARK
jgi:hypothetical protein